MSTNRILRVNQLIKKELSQILLKEVDLPANVLITVTRVETQANLIQSKVYISVMPEDQGGHVLEILNRQIYFLQQILNRHLRMRPIPKIQFIEERATREAGKIEELLEKIHKQRKSEIRNSNFEF